LSGYFAFWAYMATTIPSGVAPLDITLKQGADTTISFLWLDDNGEPMDLTNYVMTLPIRAFINSPVILLSLSSENSSGSYIQLGGTAGTFTLFFAHADTQALISNGLPASPLLVGSGFPVARVGVQNLQFIPPGGQVGYLFEGKLNLDPSV
jgi:hypothetical protein